MGHISGAETSIDGADQQDEIRSTYARLTLTHFIEPTVQLQAQLGRDIDVEQGLKEGSRLNLRFTKVF
ncbi:hypothetical protein D3C81_1783340 [compost metagenome]